ncbi:MAG: 50S ribosomal protein L17 [Candidatus Eisenbacteria bacterium]|uniref:Large ribosomal subunit protein bL17 n=1 Tax=Eiseniibacteriota bacterium TaxID=2212470 RepID=A0A538SVJ9_UNCEI|nr:MAG: 50S ribosomal protein L17 [Candidatus Eisenbacteria bacterium]
MRHRKDHRKLSRTHSHRRALLRNLVTSLIQHERIETTLAKAKEARRVGERMITFAKRGDLSARRHVARFVHGDHNVRKLFDTVAPWYETRNGGYTRILKLGRRLGDAGEMALLELVKSPELKEKLRKEEEAAIKAAKAAGKLAPARGKGAKEAAAEGEGAAGGSTGTAVEEKRGRAKEKRKAAPAKPERPGKGVAPPKTGKAPTRARQRGKSGE